MTGVQTCALPISDRVFTECMADLNLIPENCQRCEDEESITAKAVIPPHPASSYVETYVGRAVPTGQYRIDRPSGPLTSLYDKGGLANYCTVSLF